MKEKVIKPFFLQMMGLVISQCSMFGANPLALAWFGAMTTLGGGDMMFVALTLMTVGTYYSLGWLSSAKYGIIMILIMAITGFYRKKKSRVPLECAAFTTGIVTVIMELADWFMQLDISQLYSGELLMDSYFQLFVGLMVATAAGSGAGLFAMAINSFMGCISYAQAENNYLSKQIDQAILSNNQGMMKMANGFKNLSYRIMDLPHQEVMTNELEPENISEQIKSYVCNNCFNCSVCWGSKQERSVENILEFAGTVGQYGRVTRERIPEALRGQCINQKELIMGTNHLMERARINCMWKSRLSDSRIAVAMQLGEMADMVENFVRTDYRPVRINPEMENYLKQKLKEKRIIARRISITEDHREIVQVKFSARAKGRNPIPIQNAVEIFEKYVEHSLVVKQKNKKKGLHKKEYLDGDYQTIELVEEPNFMALYGIANKIKDSEKVSGDNYTVMEVDSGQMFMSVCDGMGSGKTANQYSQIVVDLLEQFLSSGFGEDTALRLINSMLMVENHWDSPIALDIGIVDLYSGNCSMAKMGAACTYIKRGNWVECIKSVSLPMGATQKVEAETVTKKLYDGDFIIMVSDGVIDSLPEEDRENAIARIIMDIDTVNPKKMADLILAKITSQTGEESRDDMTVITMGVWNKVSA